jgi:hypothetical protein
MPVPSDLYLHLAFSALAIQICRCGRVVHALDLRQVDSNPSFWYRNDYRDRHLRSARLLVVTKMGRLRRDYSILIAYAAGSCRRAQVGELPYMQFRGMESLRH